ncbi:peptidoglycan-binding protein [Actinoplanes sp. L3-i22]|uniref:peptidoglycan-binding domain-containing protein n=1 Tax=Actinoplanes sp. L3-i22 TaxID=2836373 RepID=UPI001C743955|nr:peptidoglycan-binding protein [Actinoplanes sp. L3-i22]BCY09791.1 hypothetical protein L3i22_048790 [Actinoplanes sp. L3-i22]
MLKKIVVTGFAAGLLTLTGSTAAYAETGVDVIGPQPSPNTAGVTCIQQTLGVPADGRFGQQTYDAVKAFQASSGLPADGAVGPVTGDALLEFAPAGCSASLPSTWSDIDAVPTPQPAPVDQAVSGPDNDVQLAMKCLAKTAPGSIFKFIRKAGAGTFPETEDLVKVNPWLDGAKIMKCVLWDNPQPAG